MKKLLIIAALFLLLAPVSAMAGMTTASELDLEGVTGQVGLTVTMTSMNVTATDVAWGDNDGFTGATTQGWLRLQGVKFPTIAIPSMEIYMGSTASTSYIAIVTTGNIVTGDLTISSITVGNTANAATQSLGELRVGGIGVSFGTIQIAGHAAP